MQAFHATILHYLSHMHDYRGQAKVLGEHREHGKMMVILDKTIFYPQGGGQPFDTGTISGEGVEFQVNEVRHVDGEVVSHIGTFTKGEKFTPGEIVQLEVDQERRQLHSRIHSAGHVIDSAVTELNLGWKPGKAYHFPEGPYVQYQGELVHDQIESVRKKIEARSQEMISTGCETLIMNVRPDEVQRHCLFAGVTFPDVPLVRIVAVWGEKGCPCGGTHVKNINEIGKITIPKIKITKDEIRVSYRV
jgi:Ser-tRNA(Ala) deacylase AlaX